MAQPKGHDKPSQRHLNEKEWGRVLQTVSRFWPVGLLPHASLSTRITALPASAPPPPGPSTPRGPGPGMFPAWSRRTASLHFHPGRPPSLWPPGPSMPTRLATPCPPTPRERPCCHRPSKALLRLGLAPGYNLVLPPPLAPRSSSLLPLTRTRLVSRRRPRPPPPLKRSLSPPRRPDLPSASLPPLDSPPVVSHTTTTMPPRKIKCSFDDCKAAAQRISGDCAFCNGYGPPSLTLEPLTNRRLPHRSHYCNNHRLLEDHKCQNLEDVSRITPWWLVGLSDVLSSDDSLADLCFPSDHSARRRPLTRTSCSSTASGRRSSRACRDFRKVPDDKPRSIEQPRRKDDSSLDGATRSMTNRRRRRAQQRKRQWRRRGSRAAGSRFPVPVAAAVGV